MERYYDTDSIKIGCGGFCYGKEKLEPEMRIAVNNYRYLLNKRYGIIIMKRGAGRQYLKGGDL